MQTFLPYPDYAESAKCLDNRRLGKQRVECMQIAKALGMGGGWRNHPATKMWQGYEIALCHYGVEICKEWRLRGFKDSCLEKLRGLMAVFVSIQNPKAVGDVALEPYENPKWLGNEVFHASHRANLLRKDPIWYGKFGWTESPELPYFWPTK